MSDFQKIPKHLIFDGGYFRTKLAIVSTIGFDLDMTLIDSMKSIRETLHEVLSFYSVNVNSDVLDKTVGLPVKQSLAKWVGTNHLEAYELYKNLYQQSGYLYSKALPGAKATLSRLLEKDHEVIVITAKNKKSAEIQLQHLRLPYTKIYGEVFGKGKTDVLKMENCLEYVGDHIEDFKSAQLAGVKFIGVSSNPNQNLLQHSKGAFPVIADLNDFWVYSECR